MDYIGEQMYPSIDREYNERIDKANKLLRDAEAAAKWPLDLCNPWRRPRVAQRLAVPWRETMSDLRAGAFDPRF